MNKRIISLLTAFFVLISMYSGAVTVHASISATPSEATTLLSPYEIYPLPQSQTYRGASFVITDNVNLVIESTIDESTRNFLTSILASQSLQTTQSNAAVANKTNILIGTKGSGGYVDSFFQDNVDYNAETFTHQDAYLLDIDKISSGAGNIAILGADTDAAYYGLATLKMIMDQSTENNIQSVKFEDYADAKWRGFIEGFYGFPWSHEDRMSLMRFGGTMKMNSYIFAPKDDRYHNSAWRTLYPAADLAKIKELVDVGHESKTQFVWAIHPGFSMINWNNYDAELQTLLAKLDQLYSIGVRQFGLFMDDISTSQSLTDKDKHVKLITDVANWVTAKGDVKPLIYCPPFYNQSWTGESGKPYLQALSQVPDNVELMWTGRSVVGTVNATDMQWVKDATGRDPYVWLNWPVNDYKDSRLMLGKGEVLKAGTHNISGVVSNPMGEAELSKVSLFAVADYTWNVDDFNADESWLNSFDYIAPEVASELKTIAYHLSDPSPSGHGLVVGESENIKALLEQFQTQFTAEQSLTSTGNQLISKFDEVLDAIASFKENSSNTAMLEEITPWLNSLKYVVESDKYAAKSAMALRNGELISTWEELAKATDALTESRKFTIKKLNSPDVTVEAGAKRLVPFAEQLIKKLDTQIITAIDPEAVTLMPISSYGSPSGIDRMVDGDLATNVYIQVLQQNGDWYGVDLGKITNLQDVSITQGRNDTDHDIFQRGVLEYSLDGQVWTAIGEERSGVKVVVKGLDLEARYVRYKLTHAGIPGGKPDLWTAVREFAVNADRGKAVVYTNVEELAGTAVTTTELSVQLSNLTDIQLEPAQYLGIKLPSIERIAEISLGSTNADLKLESSENGVEWEAVSLGGPYRNGAYFRLINDGQQDISFTLNQLMIKLNRFSATAVTHNYSSIYQGEIGAVFNGKLDAKVWFNGAQSVGKYVQVDMGGIVNVENVAIVIGDGEGDYFRKGDLQLSLDGQSWNTIHSFANPNDRSLNFPEHEVPYRFKRVQLQGGQQARYVRLISTDNQGSWLALNEIIVNEGIARPGTESPTVQATPQGALNNEAIQAIDHKLSTFYTPTGGTVPGQLNYKISNETKLSEIIIMQSPFGISNAAVTVRDTNGWHEAGILSQSYNSIDTSRYENVLEMKLQWDGAVAPKIHEIIPVKGDGGVIVPEVPTADLSGPTSIVGGQPFEVQLGMKSVTDSVYALDITMEYDVGVMSFDSASSMQEGISLLTTKDTPGHIRMLVISEGSDHAITGDVNILKLKFLSSAVTTTTEGAIAVTAAIMGNAQGNESEAALSTFRIQVTAAAVGVPGDVNHDGKITIGDLALIAANYGKDSSSADWEQVKRADVTNDGLINLDDLALVASRILE